jgi:hypothetical protein
MFMGHLGVALAAKRLPTKAPLWLLLVASVAPDLVDAFSGFTPWHAFANQYSHTLYGIAVLAVFMGLVCASVTRDAVASLLAGALVVSHLLLDFVTSHISLWPGGPVIGAGLYSYPIADFIVELAVIIIGICVYSRKVRARFRDPAFIGMFACLVILQIVWDAMLFKGM